MKQKTRNLFCLPVLFLTAFLLWTAAVCLVDVQAIGPNGSAVGFAGFNRFVHQCTGVHLWLYALTDWLSLVPLGCALGSAALGLGQWIRRKSLRKVDAEILILGGFYLAVMAAYLLFEAVPLNYRPILIDGRLEASYPSSTTLLALCILPAARDRLARRGFGGRGLLLLDWLAVLLVVGRLLSGVHWATDIIGSILLSKGLVGLYDAARKCIRQ